MLRLVIIPQALKPMMAPYVNQSVTQLKNTSLVSVIAVPDLVYNATLINADTYRPLEVYTVVAVIYFAILFPATLSPPARRGMTYDEREHGTVATSERAQTLGLVQFFQPTICVGDRLWRTPGFPGRPA